MGLSAIIQPRCTELGKIKIGRKSDKVFKSASGEWSPPEKIDHFLLTTMHRNKAGQLQPDTHLMNELVAEGYADPDDKLRRLPVRLLSNDPEDIMQASYCWYGGKAIWGRSDGKNVTWFRGHAQDNWGQIFNPPVVEPWKPEMLTWVDGKQNRMFKTHAVFNCVIASKGSRFGGVHKLRTTSSITASQLYGGLLHIAQLTNGVLMGLPLQLCVRPMPVTPTVKGQQISSTVYVVHIEVAGVDLQKLQQIALEQAQFSARQAASVQLALGEYRKLLREPGREVTAEEVAEVQEEFHPEEPEAEEITMPEEVDAPTENPTVPNGTVEESESPVPEEAEGPPPEPPAEPAKKKAPKADKMTAKAAKADKVCEAMEASTNLAELKKAMSIANAKFWAEDDEHTRRCLEVKDAVKFKHTSARIDDLCVAMQLGGDGLAKLAGDMDIPDVSDMTLDQATRLMQALDSAATGS